MLHALWQAQSYALQALDGEFSLVRTAYKLQEEKRCADARGSHASVVLLHCNNLSFSKNIFQHHASPIFRQWELMIE